MTEDTTPRYSEQARQAAIDAVQEEFDERGLGEADLIADVILDAAHDPQLGPNRSVNAQRHRAEVIAEIVQMIDQVEEKARVHGDEHSARCYGTITDLLFRELGTP